MYAVIMAGGSGARLWPVSRAAKPKQFHALLSDQPLLVESVERLLPIVSQKQIFIGTTKDLLETTRSLLPDIPLDNFIVEPVGKNTGPAVGLATNVISLIDKKATIAVLWSDHHIGHPEQFRATLQTAEKVVEAHPESLVTIGINPTEPSTAYGYIEMNTESEKISGHQVFKVKKFVEKPDYFIAKRYISSWQYLWNAGYFIFRAETMLKLFAKHAPKIHIGLSKISKAWMTKKREKVLAAEFAKFPNIAIEPLVVEKIKSMYVIPADLNWSDIGSWSSLHDVLANRYEANVIVKGHHVGHEDENVLIWAKDKMIATVGLKDIVVVDTPDVLLIANKNRAQDVRQLIEKLKTEGKMTYL